MATSFVKSHRRGNYIVKAFARRKSALATYKRINRTSNMVAKSWSRALAKGNTKIAGQRSRLFNRVGASLKVASDSINLKFRPRKRP